MTAAFGSLAMTGFARRLVKLALIAALVLSPVAAGLMAVETAPSVPRAAPPDAAAAAQARDLATALRAVIESGAARGEFSLDLSQLNAVLRSTRRFQPGLNAAAQIDGATLLLDLSAGAPLVPEGFWLNPRLGFALTDNGPRVVLARLGRLPLPAFLVDPALRFALDATLGDGLGAMLINGIDRLDIDGDRITIGFDFPETERALLYAELKTQVRAFAGGTDSQRIAHFLTLIDRAGDRRALPRSGSVLPYLKFILDTVRESATGREDLKAALLALTLYCGEDAFGPAVGANLGPGMVGKRNNCDGTTLGGRDDLKRHFIVSAGIYAARTGNTAFGMGEFKELLDSNLGGSGFSFDDMAADLAGGRFAQLFLTLPAADWPARLAMMQTEADILPRFDDLPSRMPDAEFRRRFGDVDSAAYAAQIAEINRRIDALPFYRGTTAP